MLNTELKILAKVIDNLLRLFLPSLISSEQSCAVIGRTIQDNLYLVGITIEKSKVKTQ